MTDIPFIRDGKLQNGSSLLKSVDVSKLNGTEQAEALTALNRAENGDKMTLKNAEAILKARAKGRS